MEITMLVDSLIGGYPFVADIENNEITKFVDSQGDGYGKTTCYIRI